MAVRLSEPAPPEVRARARARVRPDAAMPALRLVRPSIAARRIGQFLTALFLATPFVLALAPWRQSVSGAGRVVGFSPLDREFTVEAPIYGRVREWRVREGTVVRGPRVEDGRAVPGDLIAVLTNNDPEYLEALQQGLAAVRQKLDTARSQVEMYNGVVERLREVQTKLIEVKSNAVEVARRKVKTFQNEQRIAEVDRQASLTQRDWYRDVIREGLISQQTLLVAEQKYNADDQKYQKAGIEVEQARIDVEAKLAELEQTRAYTQAEIGKMQSEVAAAEAKIAEYDKERIELESKIRYQLTQEIRAPRDGIIKRLLVNEGVQQVKDGDPIAILVPTTSQLAVELYLDGNDLPLVQPGDPVRLQFEGWPAVQFVGWPSVAVGTFPGKVAVIDPGDSGKGKFRVLVVPGDGDRWPSGRYLRQGARAKGWVLLREVSLGYEIWRRLNAFPPIVAPEEPGEDGKDGGGKGKSVEPPPVEPAKEKAKIKVPK